MTAIGSMTRRVVVPTAQGSTGPGLDLVIVSDLSPTPARVRLDGEICPDTASRLLDELDALRARGVVSVEIDCRCVSLLSAAGVRALVMARDRFQTAGGGLTLVGADPLVSRVVETCGAGELLSPHPAASPPPDGHAGACP